MNRSFFNAIRFLLLFLLPCQAPQRNEGKKRLPLRPPPLSPPRSGEAGYFLVVCFGWEPSATGPGAAKGGKSLTSRFRSLGGTDEEVPGRVEELWRAVRSLCCFLCRADRERRKVNVARSSELRRSDKCSRAARCYAKVSAKMGACSRKRAHRPNRQYPRRRATRRLKKA